MGSLALEEGSGWILNLNNNEDKHRICNKCGDKLDTFFYYCKDKNTSYCQPCEFNTKGCTCGSSQSAFYSEHQHFKVVRQVKNGQIQ